MGRRSSDRRRIGALTIILTLLASGAAATAQGRADEAVGRLESRVRSALEALSTEYVARFPGRTMRTALAVVDFEAADPGAESASMAAAVSAYVETELARSLVFYLVERANLEKVLSELELSLTGLFDASDAPAMGALRAANALIIGKVGKAGDSYHVGLKLLDVGSGAIVAATAFEIPGSDLDVAAAELQYSYVAANGIGLHLGAGAMPVNPASMNSEMSLLYEVGLHYRPSRNAMYSVSYLGRPALSDEGATDYEYRPGADGKPLYGDYQPGGAFGGTSDVDSIENYMERGYQETGPAVFARYSYDMIGVNAQYTISLSPKFNIGLSGGPLVHARKPTMTLQYGTGELGGVFYRERYWDAGAGDYDYHPAIDTKLLEYTFGSFGLAGGRVELRPEFFITPRLALTLRVGYMYTFPLRVAKVLATNASWSFSGAGGADPATWVPGAVATTSADAFDIEIFDTAADAAEQYASWRYYGLNPLVNPEGARWIFDISHAYAVLSMTVYF